MLSRELRRLTRIATVVAVIAAPSVFYWFHHHAGKGTGKSLILTFIACATFRGLVDICVRRVIPWPSLFGTAEARLREEDIVNRRRAWTWSAILKWAKRIAVIITFFFSLQYFIHWWRGDAINPITWTGTATGWWDRLSHLFNAGNLPLLFQVFFLFIANMLLFMGPLLAMGVMQIKAFEPGDAEWGVKLEDVRGQAEAKEEIRRIVTLWQSGEVFEKAGGKRERGLLFLGAPGTGKTMISKAIATHFNCPFVTIPGAGFAGMFLGMDAITVQFLARKARKLAAKWGGQCIVFIDEIDAVGMRRQALGSGMTAASASASSAASIHDLCFFGPDGAITASGDVVIESREWRDRLFTARAERTTGPQTVAQRVNERILRYYPGFGMGGGGMGGMALNQLLVVMDGIDEPPLMRKVFTNRINTFLDAMFVVPSKLGKLRLRLAPPKPRQEQIYFIGACNVPIEVLDPALTRPGRMGRHIWFRTPTKDDRLDILDLYLGKVDHEPDLDTDRRRDELARITNGYSPSMIEQCCSMALTIAHTEGRREFAWHDIVEAMTTVETGTAQNIEYISEETRAVAIHEAGHAAASHVYLGKDVESTRLSIRKRGGSLGHHMSLEKEERFSHFRSYFLGRLIVVLGAMAAEHVFYQENSAGVSGDVQSATALAAMMVGQLAMGPDPVTIGLGPGPRRGPNAEDTAEDLVRRRLERIGTQIMNRASGGGAFNENAMGAVLGDGAKRTAAAELLGQAYVTAYALMAANRGALDAIADALVQRKELHGDEVGDLLDSVDLTRPELDLMNPATWPEL
ncbi:MAG: AAA family ATPase [Solirubrobacteraceae bacterium]